MPTYVYKCAECEKTEEHIHSIKEDPILNCASCDSVMKRIITHNFGGFIMKGGSPAIHDREKRLRAKKNKLLEKRQQQSYGSKGPKIQPNVAGMETDTWADAQKVAKESGMDTESYKPLIAKEKKEKKTKITNISPIIN